VENRNSILRQIAEHLDISPSDFKRAQEHYGAVARWLNGGTYQSGSLPDIYLQGSFRLGTVVRPYKEGQDTDFDIDQVCELTRWKEPAIPRTLKHDIGDRLKENGDYRRMLSEEGRRCWTLQYAEKGRTGFHLDVLPALTDGSGRQGKIGITDKINRESQNYFWSFSNPKSYYEWFKAKNFFSEQLIREQKSAIFESNIGLYRDVNEIPKQLIRSSLQRSIQIMKRHRDVHFSGRENKPISIIITTICAQLYDGGMGIIEVTQSFTRYVIKRHNIIMSGNSPAPDGILDYIDGAWSIPNPVDERENFADKWNHNTNLSKAFFEWVYQLDRDIRGFEESGLSDDLSLRIKRFGEGSSYPVIQARMLRDYPVSMNDFTNKLLELIHLGIDNKLAWEAIEGVAKRNMDETPEGESRDVARVNYYQTIRHQGRALSDKAIQDIRRILNQYVSRPNYVFCGNLLLGTATQRMLEGCIRYDGYAEVMRWPIVRLARPEFFIPPSKI
jgi:hypothetical protein